jgi:integrase
LIKLRGAFERVPHSRTQYLKNYHLLRQQQRPTYRAKPQFASKEDQRKERSHFVAFFDFCVDKKWATVNPARSVKLFLKKGDDECAETEPFTNEEVNALVAACDLFDNYNKIGIARARLRAKAIVLTFLYSGLRISDVASLKRSLITPDGKIIGTLKTGKRVYIKLPAVCIAAPASTAGRVCGVFSLGRRE